MLAHIRYEAEIRKMAIAEAKMITPEMIVEFFLFALLLVAAVLLFLNWYLVRCDKCRKYFKKAEMLNVRETAMGRFTLVNVPIVTKL